MPVVVPSLENVVREMDRLNQAALWAYIARMCVEHAESEEKRLRHLADLQKRADYLRGLSEWIVSEAAGVGPDSLGPMIALMPGVVGLARRTAKLLADGAFDPSTPESGELKEFGIWGDGMVGLLWDMEKQNVRQWSEVPNMLRRWAAEMGDPAAAGEVRKRLSLLADLAGVP